MHKFWKTLLATTMTAALLGFATTASAAFVGAYDLTNWTLSAPDGGTVDTSGGPAGFTLTGADNGSGNNAFTIFSIAAPAAGLVSFSFGYASNDFPVFDPAGYVLNGNFVQLSLDEFNGIPLGDPVPNPQSGSAMVSLAAGDMFGFYVNAQDSSFGAASLSVSDFRVAAVPEPASFALLALGMVGLVASRRRSMVAASRESVSPAGVTA